MSKVYIKVKEEVERLQNIFCDMCGTSCKDKYGMNYEFALLTASWGYGSRKDDLVWEGHFCEDCSDKIHEFIKQNGGKIEIQESWS